MASRRPKMPPRRPKRPSRERSGGPQETKIRYRRSVVEGLLALGSLGLKNLLRHCDVVGAIM
eukprot:9492553-Pyramimonas_sp.AAC.1